QAIHDVVDPALPAGVRAHYNGSLEISETYNRITLENQREFTPPILLITLLAIHLTFRSIRKTLLSVLAIAVSVPGHPRPPRRAAVRRQCDDRPGDAVAGNEQRGGGQVLRRRFGRRHHGRL